MPAAHAWFAAIEYGFGNSSCTNAPDLEVKLGNGVYGELIIQEFSLFRYNHILVAMYAIFIVNLVIYVIVYSDFKVECIDNNTC